MAERQKTTLKVIVARIIVFVLFGLLIVSFAVWGIGDIFRTGGRLRAVAEVGSVRIMPQEFQEAYRRELHRLQTSSGQTIDPQHAREARIPQQVVRSMVGRILLDLAARDASVVIGDATVRQAIYDNPNFHDQQGKFDRNIFERLVNSLGFSEDGFVDRLRHDMARAQVTDAVVAGAAVPPEMASAIYRYRNEKRVAETLTVTSSSIKDVPQPSDADLAAYYKDHAQEFTAPEYRAITAVHLVPADLASGIKMSEDKIRDEYEARAGEFHVPEKRQLRQILLGDEAKAKEAEDLLQKGTAFDDVAKKLTGKEPNDLGLAAETDILGSADLAKAVFALKEGETTKPINTPLGWHLVQVTKIEPPRTRTLDEVHDQVLHDLQLRAAADSIYALGNKLEDALGGGAKLEEAAQKLNLKVIKIASVDSEGKGPDGKPVADLPDTAKFLETAFATARGRESDLVDDGAGGTFLLRVDEVTPSAARPMSEVHDQVVKGWQDDERHRLAGKAAETLVEKAKGGAALGTLAQAEGYPYSVTPPLNRLGQGAAKPLPPELIGSLFDAKVGDIVKAASHDGTVIAKLTQIEPADPAADPNGLKRVSEELRGNADGDLLEAYEEALARRYGVEINESVLDSLIGS